MSTIKTNNVQIGQSVTATNNFTWYQPASPDGTVRLGNGNAGSVTDLITLGSTGNLTFTGTTETYTNSVVISAASTKTLTLNGGAGSNGLVIDASNNVGIGTSPSYKLDVVNNSTNIITRLSSSYAYGTAIQLANSSTGGGTWTLYSFGQSNGEGAGNFGIANVGGNKLTLDASGNLGLGVTPSAWGGAGNFELVNGAGISFGQSGGVIVSNAYYNGGWKYRANQYAVKYDQQQGSGGHFWYTAPSGTAGNAISFTQAMTLDASGNLLIGTTSTNPVASRTNGILLQQTGILVRGTNSGSYFGLNATSGTHIQFYTDNGSAYVSAGYISSNGGTTLYNAISDQRLKENIVDAPNALSSINAIKVRSFDWKADGSHSEYGYIAQELLEVAPEAVHVPTDPEEMMGVDFGKLTPRIIKALQELSQEIETLKQKVNA